MCVYILLYIRVLVPVTGRETGIQKSLQLIDIVNKSHDIKK